MMKEILIGILIISVLIIGIMYIMPSDTNEDYNQVIREKDDNITEKQLVDNILALDEDTLPNEGYPPEE